MADHLRIRFLGIGSVEPCVRLFWKDYRLTVCKKSAAVRLAKDGHSDHEIMVMGGDTLKEASRYTKGVRRKRLAENVLKNNQEKPN